MNIFKNEYKKLNKEQKIIVDEISKNLLVQAPAGTGKTNSIALRTCNIINNGILPEKILCLTFTNKACRQMKERIEKICLNSKDITIKTFHGFCYSFIKQNIKLTSISSDFLIFDEEDVKEILKEISKKDLNINCLYYFVEEIKKYPLKRRNLKDASYREIINEYIKLEGEKFVDICRRDQELIIILSKYGHILLQKYEQILNQRHGLDFNDLIIKTYELLENPSIQKIYQGVFDYIQVDEMQDTSYIEYKIIKFLSGKNTNLSIFGDLNQTIYEWRGSIPFEIIKDFKKTSDLFQEIQLKENYRSTPLLIKACDDYINSNPYYTYEENLSKKEISIKEKIILKESETLEKEAEWICSQIKNLKTSGVNYSDIAVLTRNNFINQRISKIFEKFDIPAFLVEEFKFFRRKEIKDVLSYLKILLNPFDEGSFKRVLLLEDNEIGKATLKEIMSLPKELGLGLKDFLDFQSLKDKDPYTLLLESLESNDVVIFDVESTGIDTTKDEIIQIAAIRVSQNKELEVFEKFLKLVDIKSVKDSFKVHGFSDLYLNENGQDAKEVLKEFAKFVEGKVVVGHNVSYDLSILKSQMNRMNLGFINIKGVYDTLDLSRKFYFDFPKHTLDFLSKKLNVETSPDHNAMNDIKATYQILQRIIPMIIKSKLERMNYMIKYSNRFIYIAKKIQNLFEKLENLRPHEILLEVIKEFRLEDVYSKDKNRILNIQELYEIFKSLDDKNLSCTDSLTQLMTMASLSNSELDRSLNSKEKVAIITVHQAKGLEFESVFVAGLNKGIFPSKQSLYNNTIKEEFRLFYVAMTRAKKELYLSYHRREKTRKQEISQLISNISLDFIQKL